MSRFPGLAQNFLPLLIACHCVRSLRFRFWSLCERFCEYGHCASQCDSPIHHSMRGAIVQRRSVHDFNVENLLSLRPADCPGPWAKVVLEADINLNAGIQYDRTANFWLGPVNIYFGTTAEPSPISAPPGISKAISPITVPSFTRRRAGQADHRKHVVLRADVDHLRLRDRCSSIPLDEGQAGPVAADVVLPLSAGPSGGTVTLGLDRRHALRHLYACRRTSSRAYLDVYAQSQSDDEFWYTCVPNDVAAELENCGNTAFRETEISIDGQPAGVAPVFPWIFTGGIDPFLWVPIPGVQTLNFTPYRVNLTPFAGAAQQRPAAHGFAAASTTRTTISPRPPRCCSILIRARLRLPVD